jgi:hypothetical protein
VGISLPIKARYQRAARAGFNKNERLRWTCLPETWPELVAAATNRGDDTKNVDDGRSSRAAEDVGHSSTKGGVECRGNKAAEDDDEQVLGEARREAPSKARMRKQNKSKSGTEVRSNKAAEDDGEARE